MSHAWIGLISIIRAPIGKPAASNESVVIPRASYSGDIKCNPRPVTSSIFLGHIPITPPVVMYTIQQCDQSETPSNDSALNSLTNSIKLGDI